MVKKRRAVEIVEPNRTVTAEDYMPTSEKADVEEIVLRARQDVERYMRAVADDRAGFSGYVEVSVELNIHCGKIAGEAVVGCGVSVSN